jgi:PAS domain S-box-containing protein
MHEKTFFAVTTPIVNSRNERVGTDVILVDFSGVDRLFATRQTEAVSLVLFFKKTGIFYDLIKREFKATDAEEIPLPVRQRVASGAAMKNRHGYLKGATTSGEKMLWGDKELSSADWIIFCGFSEKRTYGPIYDNLLHISLLLFVIILIASFLAKRLLGPFSGSIIVETRELEREIASRIDAVKMLNEELHHEIAERTQTGEILEKSEHRLKEAEKIAHLGHWELDLKTNSLYWSEEVYRIFGLDEGKRNLTFENFMATIHPDDKDNVLELYNNSVELGAPYSVVHRIILPDGVIKYVHEQCVHETDETGKRVKSFGTVLDVTDAKRAEELRRSAEKKEMELRKTESLRQMAGAIAHNFNNLLTAIMGGIECAIPEATGKQHKWLDMAFQSTNRAAQLGKLLLMYLGQFHVRFVSLNLDQFWRDFRNSGVVAVPDNIAIRYEIAENLPPVEGNSELLTTLFKNVIENSIEAIDKNGGLITVSCQVKEYAAGGIKNEFADADAEDVAAGRYVLVCVDDNGCGIDGAVLRNLFDPFFSTRFTGRGLGLPVVQGIVKTHRGLIKIESEQGKGTVVKILFPNGAGFNS